jgi:hypothetical protein
MQRAGICGQSAIPCAGWQRACHRTSVARRPERRGLRAPRTVCGADSKDNRPLHAELLVAVVTRVAAGSPAGFASHAPITEVTVRKSSGQKFCVDRGCQVGELAARGYSRGSRARR